MASLKEDLENSEYGMPFTCPSWRIPEGVKLTIRALTKPERDWLKAQQKVFEKTAEGAPVATPEEQNEFTHKMIALVLGDAKGVRIYSDAECEQVAKLPEPAKAAIMLAGFKLNTIGELEEEKKS